MSIETYELLAGARAVRQDPADGRSFLATPKKGIASLYQTEFTEVAEAEAC